MPADPRKEGEPPAPLSELSPPSFSLSQFRPAESQLSGVLLADRYRVKGYLASGGTAQVYLAEDLETGRPAVIKMLSGEVKRSQELSVRLLLEAKALGSIDHPNVVRVLSSGESASGVPFIALEALLGETLGDYIRRQGSPPFDLSLLLARQAASGLSAAHKNGIVHRDVKPDNLLLLGPTGEPLGLKLIDFGMAKVQGAATATVAHTILGTIEYMAPEQILAEGVDARTDVYALGVVMFRLFTGHLPFEGTTPGDLLRHQLFSSMPPPSWLDEDLDPRVELMILRATHKHPENRYANMQALLDDLDAVVGLRDARLRAPLLEVEPDIYVPSTSDGRAALHVLAERFGPYAALPR